MCVCRCGGSISVTATACAVGADGVACSAADGRPTVVCGTTHGELCIVDIRRHSVTSFSRSSVVKRVLSWPASTRFTGKSSCPGPERLENALLSK